MLRYLTLISIIFFLLPGSALPIEAKEQKHVLIIYAQDKSHPAHELTEKGIHSVLDSNLPYDIQLYAEYLDVANFPSSAQMNAAAEYIRTKYAESHIDSIITVYDTALYFMINNGAPLLPGVPIIASQLPFETGKKLNSSPLRRFTTGTITGESMSELMQSIFKLMPRTKHIALICGSSISDRDSETVYRQQIERYNDKITLISLNQLTLEEILRRVATLPANTVVLYGSLFEDAAGKMYVPREVLPRISQASNAPVFGLYDSYLGHGIIGGSLFSFEEHGKESARLLLRVLAGERPDTIPWSGSHSSIQVFDWRELKRWSIKKSLLPPGSELLYYTPSLWERYHYYIFSAFALLVLQSCLIVFLIHQRSQRRRAQDKLAERFRFEEMLSSLSARFVNLESGELDREMLRVLEQIGERIRVDRVSVFTILERTHQFHLVHSHSLPALEKVQAAISFTQVPWLTEKILAGEVLSFRQLSDIPAEAEMDRVFLETNGISSFTLIPLFNGGKVLGVLSFGMLGEVREWPPEDVRQYRLIAEVFANAMIRKRQEAALYSAEKKYRTVADFTYDWEYWQSLDGSFHYVSPSCERICGYTSAELMENPNIFIDLILPEDRDVWQSHCQKAGLELQPHEAQFRIKRRDGQVRWIEHSCQPITDDEGRLQGMRASNRDVTLRKQAENELLSTYTEIQRLKDQLEAEKAYLQEEIKLEHNFDNIVGTSASLKYVLFKVEQIAETSTTVLILGESGTGKELIARAIHSKGQRRNRSLVKVNCATLPAHLIESELFGHERGAFTGAQERHLGRFEVADGTSIFLDEIGELPLEMQAKLLRVLQEREFERLGSNSTIKVDVRIIAATNRNLENEVRKGRFREDLFFRLNVFPITVPALRQRVEDIPLLTSFFVERACKRLGKSIDTIPANIIQQMKKYPWPGNVRELENVIERAVINSSGNKLHLADDLTKSATERLPEDLRSMEEVEREHILRVLDFTGWRIEGAKGASQVLDVNPSTLRSRMRKLGIQKP